jgi:serine/threonine protein kinase
VNTPLNNLREPGDLIAERYKVEGLAGRGSFAEVYRATDVHLGRTVAVKVMAPRVKVGTGQDAAVKFAEIVERFRREAVANASLSDPNTVTMLDFGQDESDGSLFMVQEFIDGRSIRDELKADGRFEPARVARILVGALRSLREAHTKGLLHRDIKPENIMLSDAPGERDVVRVVDFGIAKATETAGLTSAGMLVGTPRYMAPERITKSAEFAPCSDIYSLGVCAYFMLTGEELYPGLNAMQLLRAHVEGEDVSLPGSVAVPGALREVVEKMMRKKMEDRYKAAQPVLEDLLPLVMAFDLDEDASMSKAFDDARGSISKLEQVHSSKTEIYTAIVSDEPTVLNAQAPRDLKPIGQGGFDAPEPDGAGEDQDAGKTGFPLIALVGAAALTLVLGLIIGAAVGVALSSL